MKGALRTIRRAGRAGNGDAVIEAAWLYYHDRPEPEAAVADRLGVSRATVPVNYPARKAREAGPGPGSAWPTNRSCATAWRWTWSRRFGTEGPPMSPHRNRDGERRRRSPGGGGAAQWLPSLLAPGTSWAWPGVAPCSRSATCGADRDPRPDGGPAGPGSMASPLRFTAENCSARLAQRLGATCIICMSRRCCPPPGWPRSFGASRSSPSSWRRSAAATRRCSPPARARRTAISSAPASRRRPTWTPISAPARAAC